MTTEEAIAWFEKCKPGIMIKGARAMYDKAIAALQAQRERENPKPLTLGDLLGMDGEPVWVCSVKEKGKIPDQWMLLAGFRAEGSIFLFVPTAGLMQGYKESSYAKTWLAYRHKPKEG